MQYKRTEGPLGMAGPSTSPVTHKKAVICTNLILHAICPEKAHLQSYLTSPSARLQSSWVLCHESQRLSSRNCSRRAQGGAPPCAAPLCSCTRNRCMPLAQCDVCRSVSLQGAAASDHIPCIGARQSRAKRRAPRVVCCVPCVFHTLSFVVLFSSTGLREMCGSCAWAVQPSFNFRVQPALPAAFARCVYVSRVEWVDRSAHFFHARAAPGVRSLSFLFCNGLPINGAPPCI
eukprot:1158704-Pelagomonas_calceolata.AAC.1